ncbi:hypothetical protein EC957_005939 [Mortierella hygrophila]|uniref:Uncharacterized protein n=1 Tax=Mortierella hygrophila TaxID=979708 RepID=A0A9P6FEI7_9FUNG|nr:hypothetical protein EC957_005939 [Mortierella hygrophila]
MPRRNWKVFRFIPYALHSCGLVSKFWRSTLILVAYNSLGMEHVPQEVSARYSSETTDSMANPQLRILHWGRSSATNNILDPEDFVALKSIEHLEITGWNVSGGALGDTLKSLSGSLTKLSVFMVRGAEDGIFLIMSTGVPQPAGFAQFRPNLKNLSITFDANVDLDRFPRTITYCPALDALYLRDYGSSINKVDLSSRLIRDAIESGPGKPVTLCLALFEARPRLISTVLLNALTVENLKITYIARAINTDRILALLCGCSQLNKVFTLFMQGRAGSNIDILHKLRSKPWGCTGLARFELHIPGDQLGSTNNGATGEAEDEDWVGFDVASLISRTYGWRLHPQKSNYQRV